MSRKHTFEDFRRNIIVNEKTGCWEWQGQKDDKGYAHMRIDGEQWVHIWAYKLFIGPIPEGLVLDHIVCSNTSCVNPYHLTPSTRAANTARDNWNSLKDLCPKCDGAYEYRKNGRRFCRPCRNRKQRYRRRPEAAQ